MMQHVDSFKDVFQKLWRECTQKPQVKFTMTAWIMLAQTKDKIVGKQE
jgi:hypothetical protein